MIPSSLGNLKSHSKGSKLQLLAGTHSQEQQTLSKTRQHALEQALDREQDTVWARYYMTPSDKIPTCKYPSPYPTFSSMQEQLCSAFMVIWRPRQYAMPSSLTVTPPTEHCSSLLTRWNCQGVDHEVLLQASPIPCGGLGGMVPGPLLIYFPGG